MSFVPSKVHVSPSSPSAPSSGEGAWVHSSLEIGQVKADQRPEGDISAGSSDPTTWEPSAVGGSAIHRWADGGDLNKMMVAVIQAAKMRYTNAELPPERDRPQFVLARGGDDFHPHRRAGLPNGRR